MNRTILHIDMDAFYASVEQRDNPKLIGKPVIVGGTSNRGVVSAASYEARKFGVHSAMPIFQARQKCPDGIFLPVRMERYKEVSRQIMAILEAFSPLIEQVSIDEAYMDISRGGRLFGPLEDIGNKIKQRIKKGTSLNCSIGIAPNKFLAKIASDLNKPDGLTVIRPDEVCRVIGNLPIEKVPGAGKKTVLTLQKLGISLLGDIRRLPERLLQKNMGKFGRKLLDLSMGIDESPVMAFCETKSISSEDTLPTDTNDMAILMKQLLIQSEIVGRRLREKALKGATVTLKLKRSDFTQITRSITLDEPTNSSNVIYEQGLLLLKEFTSTKFRLIGVGVSNIVCTSDRTEQLSLFGKPKPKDKSWEDVEKAMDTIEKRFGRGVIKRGGLL